MAFMHGLGIAHMVFRGLVTMCDNLTDLTGRACVSQRTITSHSNLTRLGETSSSITSRPTGTSLQPTTSRSCQNSMLNLRTSTSSTASVSLPPVLFPNQHSRSPTIAFPRLGGLIGFLSGIRAKHCSEPMSTMTPTPPMYVAVLLRLVDR